MKVLFDHQIFEYQTWGGISRYYVELINHFNSEIEVEVSLKFSNNKYIESLGNKAIKSITDYRKEFIRGIEFLGKGRLLKYLSNVFPERFPIYYQENLKASIDKIRKKDFDIFHPTFYNDYFIEHLDNKPFVLTIHDLSQEIYPEYFASNDWVSLNMRKLTEKAAHIIAISENTKVDIINYYGVKEDKISVVYHGVRCLGAIKDNRIVEGDYILYVGAREGYKNFLFFINSIAEVLRKRDLKLVCTGTLFTTEESKLFKYLGIENKVVNIIAEDHQMANLYSNAIALVIPSLYEGFGMPILEAFTCDCPVLLSNTSCFPEIARDAALYFDPKNDIEISEKLGFLLQNESVRKDLIIKGRLRVKSFSWEKAANETLRIYQNII